MTSVYKVDFQHNCTVTDVLSFLLIEKLGISTPKLRHVVLDNVNRPILHYLTIS